MTSQTITEATVVSDQRGIPGQQRGRSDAAMSFLGRLPIMFCCGMGGDDGPLQTDVSGFWALEPHSSKRATNPPCRYHRGGTERAQPSICQPGSLGGAEPARAQS